MMESLFIILVLISVLLLVGTIIFFVATYITRLAPSTKGTDLEKGSLPLPSVKVPNDEGGFVSVRKYGWDEIRSLTLDFTAPVIGHGGFSTVYLGKLSDSDKDSAVVAVKVHRDSERLHLAFKQELDVLLRVRHENIVRLLGYCDEKEEGALVFEYIPNGTLHEILHCGGPSTTVLTWRQRMRIAYDLAAAIHYLHSTHDLQIVHSDIKPSNILLDSHLRPKLCDFGSSKIGFSSTISAATRRTIVGSPGYTDPHYLRTGMTSKKSDVYSFGVVLLEMVTGEEGFCEDKGRMKVGEVVTVDRRVVAEVAAEEVGIVVELGKRCIGEQPSLRPTMAEIVRVLGQKMAVSRSSVPAVERKNPAATEVFQLS